MAAIEIRTDAYWDAANTPNGFKVYINPADEALAPLANNMFAWDCTIGTLDVPNRVFPTFASALTNLVSTVGADFCAYIDSVRGTTGTTIGTIYAYMSKTTHDALAAKLGAVTPMAFIASAATNAATNAPTNLNVVTTLLGTLTGEVNATNAKQNDLATKYNDLATKFNTMCAGARAQGFQLPS